MNVDEFLPQFEFSCWARDKLLESDPMPDQF
jgi:hypothetical protein